MNKKEPAVTTMKWELLACFLAIIPAVATADGSADVLFPQNSMIVNYSGTQLVAPGTCAEGDSGCFRQPEPHSHSVMTLDLSASYPSSPAERWDDLVTEIRLSPYPAHLLKESGLLKLKAGDLLPSLAEVVTSSVIAVTSKAGKVVGTYVIKEGPYADYIQATISTVTGLFAAAKSGPVIEPSMVESSLERLDMFESSLNSLKSISSSFSSLKSLESLSEAVISEEVGAKAVPGIGVSGYAKVIASKIGLVTFSITALRALFVRGQEYFYNAGLTADSIEFYDDDGLVNQVAFIHMNVPATSRNSYYAAVAESVSSYLYGEEDKTTLEWKSANLPHIDIVPRQKRLPLLDRAFTYSGFLRNLVTLADTMPERATLRIFPGVDPETSALTYSFAIIHLGLEGNILSHSPLITIQKDWGSSAGGKLVNGQNRQWRADIRQPATGPCTTISGARATCLSITRLMPICLLNLLLPLASYRRAESHATDNFVVFF